MEPAVKKRLVVGISGASGTILGIELLRALRGHAQWETHLVMSEAGEETARIETGLRAADIARLADYTYGIREYGAAIASGTFQTAGMIIAPCSMKTAAGIACGYADSLLLRAADVTIKEGRRLLLAARETPLSAIHLRNLTALAELGVVIMPPMVTHYNAPSTVDAMNRHIVCKMLERFGIEAEGFQRWGTPCIP